MLITFATESGNSESAAEALSEQLNAAGVATKVHPRFPLPLLVLLFLFVWSFEKKKNTDFDFTPQVEDMDDMTVEEMGSFTRSVVILSSTGQGELPVVSGVLLFRALFSKI